MQSVREKIGDHKGGASLLDALTKLVGRFMGDADLGAVAKGAFFAMGIRVGGAAVALVSQVLLARWMGVFEYGVFAYVWVWVTLLGFIAGLGLPDAIMKLHAQYRAKTDWERIRGVLVASRRMAFSFGLLLMGAGWLFLYAGTPLIDSYYVAPFAIGLLCVPVQASADVHGGMARANGWVNLAYMPHYIFRPLGILLIVGTMEFSGMSPTGISAVAALFGAVVAASTGQFVILKWRLHKHFPRPKPIIESRIWLLIALPFLMIQGFELVIENMDTMMIGHYLTPESVGIYYASVRINSLAGFVLFSVMALATPKIAEFHAAGDKDDLRRFLSRVTHMIFWPTLGVVLGLVVLGPLLLGLFGGDFGAAYPALLVLLAGMLVRAAGGPVDYLLNMTGHQKHATIAYGIAASTNLVLNIAFIPQWGILGAAIATAVSRILLTLILSATAWRMLGIRAFVFAR